jgi:branched-chain amino acid transport system ATP-binding protein
MQTQDRIRVNVLRAQRGRRDAKNLCNICVCLPLTGEAGFTMTWWPALAAAAVRELMMTVSDAVLELSRLSVGYDRAPVVRDLTLTVNPGEVVALLGANGAGKTTTLRAVSGFLKPASGEVKLRGRDLAGVSPAQRARLGIAHVPHDRGIFFGLTVAEHFRLDGRASAEIDAAFDHFPALRKLGGRKAGLLSGGEQQMLAIARALSRGPRLLMLDEMSLGLAPVIVERLLPVVREYATSSGTSVLLVEQHVHLALRIADRGYILAHGELAASGSAESLRTDSALLAASYLGGAASHRGTPR